MKVYRLANRKYARDTTGEGARLHGGRWNHIGTPCLYTAESRSLAILEYSVNVELFSIPRTLCIVTLRLPDVPMLECPLSSLPGNWAAAPAPAETKDFGTKLLKAAQYPVLKIPSAVVPQEFNYLVNPLHPDIAKLEVVEVVDFIYDIRIKDSGSS
ncbi:RES family NAD+ phosphorylase [Paraflavisolibacter sp. H34]|uniref:RES family NAD+ phosphorylase n=1 Tax=Huijunlia imazamoxiresistens TaxID=3127457 RepID=UPI003019695F